MKLSIYSYVIGALLLVLTGCGKNEVSNDVIHDGSPVPITVGVGADVAVESKAAVDGWYGDTVCVFGLKRQAGGSYDYDDPGNIVEYPVAVTSSTAGSLEIYSDPTSRYPYFYSEGALYDFFAYHLGGAKVHEVRTEGMLYSMDVELSGCNDLMYAYTDRSKDLARIGDTNLKETSLYSASSARYNVTPRLIFEHVLSRFIFVVKGQGKKYDMVEIEGVEVKAYNRGWLTVNGGELGFEVPQGAEMADVALRLPDGKEFVTENVYPNPHSIPIGGPGACIMVAPGLTELSVNLKMVVKESGVRMDYPFVVRASDIRNQQQTPSKEFKAGSYYMIYINVYGPEEIVVSGLLENWKENDYLVDPDEDDSGITILPDDDEDDIENGVSVGDYDEGGHLGDIVD